MEVGQTSSGICAARSSSTRVRILDRPHAVADTLGVADVEDRADRLRTRVLAGVRHAVEPFPLRRDEMVAEGLVRVEPLAPGQTQSRHHSPLPAGERPIERAVRRLDADVAHDVRDQAQGDAVAPLPFRDRLGQGREHLAAIDAVGEVGRDREVDLGVDDVLVRLLGQEVERQELEVLGGPQRPRAGEVDLDEVLEVGEAEPALETRLVLGRQLDAVAPRQLQQHGRPHRAFQMDVELDFGETQQEALEAHAVPPEPALAPDLGGSRCRSLASTGSGTSPVRSPPSEKTSFTSRLDR